MPNHQQPHHFFLTIIAPITPPLPPLSKYQQKCRNSSAMETMYLPEETWKSRGKVGMKIPGIITARSLSKQLLTTSLTFPLQFIIHF